MYTSMAWINGQKKIEIAITDRALAYGDGLFESIACINRQLHLWPRHWQRLQQGAEQLALLLPEQQWVLSWIDRALAEQGDPALAVVKIIITRGSGGRGYRSPEHPEPRTVITVYPWPEHSEADYQEGIAAMVCQTTLAVQPKLAGIKHLNRLEQVLAAQELMANNCYEGLMLEFDPVKAELEKKVIEGVSSNLFFVSNGQLLTPEITCSGVNGTLRQEVLHRSAVMGITVKTGPFSLQDVLNADEVFFSNSIFGILPVREIVFQNDQQVNHKPIQYYQQREITMQVAASLNPELQRPRLIK